MAYYPGDTIVESNQMGITNLVYTIIGNSTTIPELDISIDTQNITITFPQDMTPDSFSIVFLEEITNEVVQTVYRGGGSGGSTRYVDRNVTVEVPKFYDRNITTPGETITLEPKETIVEVEKHNFIKDFVIFCLGMIFLLILIVLYNKFTERDDEYEYKR